MKSEFKIRSVKYNFLMNIILKISQYIFPLITLPYITRALGAVGLGKVSFTASVITYFSMFAQLGIPSYGIRECAKVRDDKNALTKLVQELLLINFVSVAISYIALVISLFFVPKFSEEPLLLIIQSMTIVLNMFGIDWMYQAIEQYQYITIRNISFKFISVLLMFLFIHNPEDYIKYGILLVLSASGSNLLNLLNSRKILVKKSFKGQYDLKKHLKPILIFFSMSIAVSIYTSLDTVMIGFISGDVEVAFYSIGTKIKMVLASTVAAIGPVLMPRISYCLHNDQIEKFKSYINKSLHFVLLVSIPFTIFFAISASDTILILGGREYLPASLCMQIIVLSIIPLGIGNIAASQILAPMGREKYTMYSTIAGAIIDCVLNFIFIPSLGAAGAAVATVITEMVVTGIQLKYAWAEIKDAAKGLPYIKIVICNCCSCLIMLLINLATVNLHCFLKLIIAAISYFGSYIVLLIILKDSLIYGFTSHYFETIKVKINKR